MPTSPPNAPSAAGSPASSTASPATEFLADAGPAFDPGAAAAAPELPGLADAAEGGPTWSAGRVRGILTAKGELLHGAVAVDKDSTEWRYTQADLQAIAGPLARILNRYDATRAAAAAGDEVTVAVGFAGYAVRSWSERMAALRYLRALEGTQPEPDAYTAAGAAAGVPHEPADVDQAADDDGPPPVPPISSPRRF